MPVNVFDSFIEAMGCQFMKLKDESALRFDLEGQKEMSAKARTVRTHTHALSLNYIC